MPRQPLIGFNSDEETKRLASILAAKLKFDNVSEMMREMLRKEFESNFTPKLISELLGISIPEAHRMLESDGVEDDPKDSKTRSGRAAPENVPKANRGN